MSETISVILTETITPWLLGTLLMLAVLTVVIAAKSWREMKRSPYFFQRRQAEKRLQTYGSASFFLLLFAVAVTLYSWRVPLDTTPRVAVLAYAKPARGEIVAFFENATPAETETALRTADVEQAIIDTPVVSSSETALIPVELALPDEYNQIDPVTPLKENTALSPLAFSTEITEQFDAVNPANLFAEGFYTLWATFDYDDMANGMAWSWIWRHNGQVVDGGNKLWNAGNSGPGYIYFNPEEGFQFGEYSLEVWVNGEMMVQSEVTMNSAALAAGN